jgi:hypothetical protein
MELEQALSSLRDQGVQFGEVSVRDGGFVHEIGGYLLTSEQILKLQEGGELNLDGIRNFDKSERESIERHILAFTEGASGEFRTGTAETICRRINEIFNSVHSAGQVAAVLNRLGLEYKGS